MLSQCRSPTAAPTDPSTLHRLSPPSLAFLAPGLLHQLGNQLFAIQGSAQLLPEDAVTLRPRILAAVQRGNETLRVLRALLGDAMSPRLPLAQALEPLLQVARVSLRERGHRLEAPGSPADGGMVDGAAVVAGTAHAISLLVELVPSGVAGTFSVQGAMTAGAATVAIRFAPAAGSLPFPLATEEVRLRLERDRAGSSKHPSCRAIVAGVELSFPDTATAFGSEA